MISLAWIENPCQLMIVPGTLVIVSALPSVLNVALPDTTVGPVGFAFAAAVKQEATATVSAWRLSKRVRDCGPSVLPRRRVAEKV